MNFDRMRELLLSQASRGKLVSQLKEEGVVAQIGDVPREVPFTIPKSWKWVQLKSIGHIVGGGTPKTSVSEYWNGDISWITPADLGKNTSRWIYAGAKSITTKGLKESSAKLMPKGSVVYSSRAPIGHIAIAGQELCTNQGCKSFVPDREYITTEWAYYMLKARTKDIQSRASGTTFKEISGKGMGDTWITLPPLEEQSRIVTRLEEAFAEIDRAEKAYQELQTLSGVLRGQILQEAIQGKLVPQLDCEEEVEQIGDAPEDVPFAIPEKWKWKTLKSITGTITDGTHHSPKNSQVKDEVFKNLYVTAKNIKYTGVDLCKPTYVDDEVHAEIVKRCSPAFGDVLFVKDGATTGVVTVNDLHDSFSMLSSVALIKTLPEVLDSQYLVYVLRSPVIEKVIRSKMKGTGIPRVTLKILQSIPIPVPPFVEQLRIVEKVHDLLKQVDALSGK